MKNNIILIILIGLFFITPPAIKSQPILTVEKVSGSLAEKVKKASENQLVKDSNLFRVPDSEQMKAWRLITENILQNRLEDAAQMIKKSSFPYKIMLLTDQSAKREYVVLEEDYPLSTGWGFYVFDLNSANPLVLEIPHPVFDRNTEFQGIDAFLQTGAKAYLLAGAHRRANLLAAPCTQTKSNEDVNYSVSDVAHAVTTPFQAVHETLVKTIPTTVAVQLHGMGERDICPNAFLSTGTATVTTNSKTLSSCLTKTGVETDIYVGNLSCPLIALTNVQGRFSNGETQNPCNTAAKTSPEPGSFIHIEQEPAIRRNRESWQPVIAALQCAFPLPKNKIAQYISANGRNSFIFKSTGNPDVKVYFSVPLKISAKTKVLLVMAGRQRDADNYIDSWIEWGAKNDYLILAPQFDVKNWVEPLGYNFGNIASGKEQENTPNQKSKWAFDLIERMFAETREKYSLKTKKYDLFGHSAGGQFVHRFMLFYPENHVRLAIAANPGFYTLPDLNENFPYGLKKSPVEISRRDLLKWTKRDLIIMRGTADIQRTENLRQTPEADAQGQNRFERAGFMFGKIKSLNPQTKWQLIDVPKIAHDQKGMAQAAQKVLENMKK